MLTGGRHTEPHGPRHSRSCGSGTRRASTRRPVVAAVVGLTVALGLLPSLVVPSHATPQAGVLRAQPTTVEPGAVVHLSGRVPTRRGARAVVLQRQAGQRWVRVARALTARNGSFAFSSARSATTTYRVRAPRVRDRRLRAVVTPSRRVVVREAVPPTPPTRLASVADDGTPVTAIHPALSADGSRVAFVTESAAVVPGADANTLPDAYVHDRITGRTLLVSAAVGGSAAGMVSYEADRPLDLSDDGRYVTFVTTLPRVTGTGNPSQPHVFLRDLDAGTTAHVSVGGTTWGAGGREPRISGDGRHVVFWAPRPGGGPEVLVRWDRTTGSSEAREPLGPVPVPAPGQPMPSVGAGDLDLSRTGRFVAMAAVDESKLVGPTRGVSQVWLYDWDEEILVPASQGPDGPSRTSCTRPSISANGRFVVFDCAAAGIGQTNLAPGVSGENQLLRWDRDTGRLDLVNRGTDGQALVARSPQVSASGRYVSWVSGQRQVPGVGDATGQVLVWDATTGRHQLVSTAPGGGRSPGAYAETAISADAGTVAFRGRDTASTAGPQRVFVRAR